MFSPLTDASLLPITATHFVSNLCCVLIYSIHFLPHRIWLQPHHSRETTLRASYCQIQRTIFCPHFESWQRSVLSFEIYPSSGFSFHYASSYSGSSIILMGFFLGLLSMFSAFLILPGYLKIPHIRVQVLDRILPSNGFLFL